MRYTRLEHSPEYVRAREDLRVAELELMRHREQVAEQRRALPEGPVVDDYVFEEGPAFWLSAALPAFIILPGKYIDALPPSMRRASSTDQVWVLRSSISVSVAYSEPPT